MDAELWCSVDGTEWAEPSFSGTNSPRPTVPADRQGSSMLMCRGKRAVERHRRCCRGGRRRCWNGGRRCTRGVVMVSEQDDRGSVCNVTMNCRGVSVLGELSKMSLRNSDPQQQRAKAQAHHHHHALQLQMCHFCLDPEKWPKSVTHTHARAYRQHG